MSIEFRCPSCDKLLRVADAAAGKQARCPACACQTLVPDDSTSSTRSLSKPLPSQFEAPRPDSGTRPFDLFGHAGAEDRVPPSQSPPPPAAAVRGITLDAGRIFHQAWAIMRRQMLLCILGPIIAWFAGSIGVAMIETFFTIAAKAVGTREVYMLCQMIVSLLSFAIYILLETGLTIFFLRIARGQEADLGDIFRGVRCFGHICGSNILTQLGVSIGMLFFLVPGVIVALMLSQHKFLVIDRKLGILDSLTVSSRLTYGNKLNLLVLWAAASLIYLAGALACFVGLLVALPLVHLMMTVAYLTLSGQPFGESRGNI